MAEYKVIFAFEQQTQEATFNFTKKEMDNMAYVLNNYKKTDGLAAFGNVDSPFFVAMDKVLSISFQRIEDE